MHTYIYRCDWMSSKMILLVHQVYIMSPLHFSFSFYRNRKRIGVAQV